MSSVVLPLQSRDHWLNGLMLNDRGARWETSVIYSTRFAMHPNGRVSWLTTCSPRGRSRQSRRHGAMKR